MYRLRLLFHENFCFSRLLSGRQFIPIVMSQEYSMHCWQHTEWDNHQLTCLKSLVSNKFHHYVRWKVSALFERFKLKFLNDYFLFNSQLSVVRAWGEYNPDFNRIRKPFLGRYFRQLNVLIVFSLYFTKHFVIKCKSDRNYCIRYVETAF